MNKIHTQLSVILICLYLGCSLVLLITAENLLRRNMEEQLVDNMRRHCLLIDESLPPDLDSLQAIVDRLKVHVDARITLIDSTGVVLVDTEVDVRESPLENHIDRDEVQQAIGSADMFGTSQRYSATIKQDLLYTAYRSPRSIFIRLAHNLSFIQDYVFGIRVILVIAATVSALIALLSILKLSRYLTRPVVDLIQMTKKIGDAQYHLDLPTDSNNELGELGRAIRAMGTKLRSNIDKWEQVQAMRRDFIANASHELKTPVSAIKGYVETLLEGALEDKKVNRRFLERALSNVDRLEVIVNDMLDLSRLESQAKTRDKRHIQLEEYIHNTIEDFTSIANSKGLTLHYYNDLPDNFRLLVDPSHLDKAIINLLDNAVKYSDSGSVTVHSRLESEACVISVEDTGRGIGKKDLARIFERFYRVDKARSRELGGSGLGLAIVKHVMEMYKGSVTVVSEFGKGTKFTLTFPISKSQLPTDS